MITEKNTSPRKAFRSAPKSVEQDASLENASCSDSKEEQAVLSGVKPVLELLEREPERIDAVLVRKGKRSQDTDRILDLCRTAKVRFTLADAQSLDRLCPAGHQGVVARLFEAGFTEFADLLTDATDAPLPLILVLDQVQDPGNAGTLARTLYAMGGAGLVIPRHNGTFLGAGARRAAAGALERLPVAKVMNIARALEDVDRPTPPAEVPDLFDRLNLFIEEHLAQDVTLERAAREFFVSKSTIDQLFRKKLGISFYRYLTQSRLIAAKERILEGEALGRICTDVGFADYSTFYRAFRREYGVAPSDFRDFNRL